MHPTKSVKTVTAFVKQNYICKQCRRQFVEFYSSSGYPESVKRECLEMYLNGMGFRGIERVKGVHHTERDSRSSNKSVNLYLMLLSQQKFPKLPNLMNWKHLSAQKSESLGGNKREELFPLFCLLWSAVNKHSPGFLAWVLGDRSVQTFNQLWKIVKCWQSFWYATDGYVVYKQFVEEDSHVVSKTYMTRVEGENTRFRHYLARLHQKTLCYSKSQEMLKLSIRLLLHYLQEKTVPLFG